jgi:NADPH:quinone reductase-like Zn-dependent oxidoreductase
MTITLPTTMKAVEAPAAGPINTMKVVTTRPVPQLPEPGSDPAVIVKVEFAALNHIDWKMAEYNVYVSSWPHVFGCDMSGTVVESSVGSGFSEGAKVWAYTLLGQPHSGTLAEYVRVPAAMVGHVPEGVSMEAASTVGVGSMTAAFGLYKTMELPTKALKEGFPVLVYGASSTVGVFAMSLLKAAGYRSIAVASAQHHAWLTKSLGAGQCVDYHDAGWPDAIAAMPENRGLEYALDCIGGAAATSIDDTLEKCEAGGEGRIATVDPFVNLEGKSALMKFDIGSVQTGPLLQEAGRYVTMIDGLLTGGALITMPTRMLGGLETAIAGMEMLKTGKVHGEKLVVKV